MRGLFPICDTQGGGYNRFQLFYEYVRYTRKLIASIVNTSKDCPTREPKIVTALQKSRFVHQRTLELFGDAKKAIKESMTSIEDRFEISMYIYIYLYINKYIARYIACIIEGCGYNRTQSR